MNLFDKNKESVHESHYENRVFSKLLNTDFELSNKEFEQCVFTECVFSSASLSGAVFLDCRFENCALGMVKFGVAVLRDVTFVECKLMGADFSSESDFSSFSFEHCQLDYALFQHLTIKKTRFIGCSLKDADFSSTDLTLADFSESNCAGTLFDRSNLEKADFRTARNFSIDPERNKVKKAQFSVLGLLGLLDKYDVVVE